MGSNPTLSATINRFAVPSAAKVAKIPRILPEVSSGRIWRAAPAALDDGLENAFFSAAFIPQYGVWSPIYLI